MKIKNRIAAVLLLVMLACTASAVYGAIIGESAKIDISLISQESDPASPGEVVDLRFRIENKGGQGTDNLFFEVMPEYPFSLYSGEKMRDLGTMRAYQRGEEALIVLYKMKVDEAAVEGTDTLDIRYKLGERGNWIYEEDFEIRIRTRDLVVSMDSIESDPEKISPGEEFELSFTIQNNADSLVKDVTVNLDLSGSDIPFAPSTSTSEKQIYQISSKTGKIMVFDLVALPDAEGGIYKVPVTLSYTDETGESYSKEDIISLKVASAPDLLVTLDSTEISAKKKSGSVVVRIVNRGLTNIKLLTAKVQDTEDISLLSNSEVYVGDVDSDDYETAEFSISVDALKESVTIPLKLNYMDSTNRQHKEEVNLNLKVYKDGIASSIFSSVLRIMATIGAIIGAGLAIRWFYKKRQKKRKG